MSAWSHVVSNATGVHRTVDSFVRYLGPNEQRTLALVSNGRFFKVHGNATDAARYMLIGEWTDAIDYVDWMSQTRRVTVPQNLTKGYAFFHLTWDSDSARSILQH